MKIGQILAALFWTPGFRRLLVITLLTGNLGIMSRSIPITTIIIADVSDRQHYRPRIAIPLRLSVTKNPDRNISTTKRTTEDQLV